MEFIALYCLLPLFVVAGAIGLAAMQAYLAACEKQRKIELHNAKLAEARMKRELHQKTIEMRAAKAANEVVLQDIRIDTEKAKLLKLQKELGLTAPGFDAKDYDSDRAPYNADIR